MAVPFLRMLFLAYGGDVIHKLQSHSSIVLTQMKPS